ncbi:GAF domain-containing protein [Streptomyces sp. NPDC060243]|uniref:GAF domain-containing protein n=1 Tax=Streptomyces sp. NPDC060243 TaxID=3347081 RepID=UPI00365893B5
MNTGRLLLLPDDPEAPERERRLAARGLGAAPVPALDAHAARLAAGAGASFAGVNFVHTDHQYLAGLHPRGVPAAARRVARAHGFSPYVVVRRKALVLDDVRDYPRFSPNEAVDFSGIRAYLGAPLTDHDGFVLGTLWAAAREPRDWGREALALVKTLAAEVAPLVRGTAGA